MSRLNVNQIYTRTGTGSPAIREIPAFRVYNNAQQNVTSNVETKAILNTKTGDNFYDTNNWFDIVNYRYIPQVAGYYFFSGMLRLSAGGVTAMTTQSASLFKNNSRVIANFSRQATGSPVHVSVSDTIYLNGSTDYVELWGIVAVSSGGTPQFSFADNSACSILSGFLLRAD